MRVLLITDNHAPTGGAEKYFFELKEKLQGNTELEVFSLGFGKAAANGSDYTVLPATRSKWSKLLWQIFTHRPTLRKIRKAIARFHPDVIHLHNNKQHSAAVLKAVAGYHVVQTIHDYSIVCPAALNLHKNLQPCATGFKLGCFWQHQLKFNRVIYLGLVVSFMMMKMRMQKTVRHFMTVSPLLADYMQKNALHPVTYIPPFHHEQPINLTPPATGHFLYAGHFGAHKGTHLLIEEFALACKQNPNLRLTLAGSGDNEVKLRELVKHHHLVQHVTFTGWLDDLTALYQAHFAVIAPSIVMEAFGLIISEAMSHQRPVIGSNRGSIPWLVEDEVNGLIFDPVKKGDLARQMLRLAENPVWAQELGKQGREKMRGFINNDASLEKILLIYKNSAHSSGRQP